MSEDRLAPLRARFVERAAGDLEILRAEAPDAETRLYVVHRLAGAAGLFGFGDISKLASIVDDQLQDGGEPEAADLAALIAALEALASS